jgi:hypothetical protein
MDETLLFQTGNSKHALTELYNLKDNKGRNWVEYFVKRLSESIAGWVAAVRFRCLVFAVAVRWGFGLMGGVAWLIVVVSIIRRRIVFEATCFVNNVTVRTVSGFPVPVVIRRWSISQCGSHQRDKDYSSLKHFPIPKTYVSVEYQIL